MLAVEAHDRVVRPGWSVDAADHVTAGGVDDVPGAAARQFPGRQVEPAPVRADRDAVDTDGVRMRPHDGVRQQVVLQHGRRAVLPVAVTPVADVQRMGRRMCK